MAPSSGRPGRYTEQELIAYLQQRAKELGMVPTMRSLQLLKGPSPITYLSRFGSWRNALLKAGLVQPGLVSNASDDDTDRQSRMRYTDDDLVEFIQRYVQEHDGQVPTVAEFREWTLGDPNMPTPMTLSQRFGSWNAALQRAGYIASDSRVGRSDRESAIDFLREAARELGHEPTVVEYNEWVRERRDAALAAFEADYGPKPETKDTSPEAKAWRLGWREQLRHSVPVGARTLFRHFGSWTTATMEALKPPSVPSVTDPRVALLEALHRLAHELGRVPTTADVRAYTATHPEFPPQAAFRMAFGPWVDVKRRYMEWRDSGAVADSAASSAEPTSVAHQRILAGIHLLYRHIGRVPRAADFYTAQQDLDPAIAGQVPSYEDILRTFGSWPKARRMWSDTYHIAKAHAGRGRT